LKIFVTTSDWYNPILPCFAHLFNWFWSPDQEVTILCYTVPDIRLPPNFTLESLGDPPAFGNVAPEWSPGTRGPRFGEPYPTPKWTDSLKGWADRLKDPAFILLQIDYFLCRPVNLQQVRRLEEYLKIDNVVKIDLSPDRFHDAHSHFDWLEETEVIVSSQSAQYRSSLQAAIWKRDYFVSLLKPGRSPWDFEVAGMYEQMNDGKLILGLAEPDFGPVPYLNVYRRGQVDWRELGRLNPALLERLMEQGLIGPNWNGWVDRVNAAEV
jgi:hypothetical protein